MNGDTAVNALLERAQKQAFLIGAAGLVLCAVGFFAAREQFFHSYLMAWLFWTALSLGCLALLMLHHLAGGSWGFVIRRVLEAGTRTLPVAGAFALLLLLGIPTLYLWAQPEHVRGDKVLEHKAPYLNAPFFAGRAAFYFAVWFALAYFLNKWSEEQDRTGDPKLPGRMEGLSGGGLVAFGLTASFAALDWAMSLEPHWFSTIYGLHFMIGGVLSALAFAVVVLGPLSRHEPLSKYVGPARFHDLGSLLFAFVMLWAYLSFSQFLIIWSGNLPEEIPWYLHRIGAGWQSIALTLVVFHFAVPFVLLLSRDIKRRPGRVARLAVVLLVMRLVDMFWLVQPAFHPEEVLPSWQDFCWVAGLGGVWLGFFFRELKRRPLVAQRDPMAEEILAAREAAHLEPGSESA